MVSVIASSVRKGNVLEKDGKLYLVITAENIHPGKGTPVTHLEMRRISDGVKTVERLRTTDSVEKAFVEHQTFNYLYQDGEQYIFMQPQTFDQLHVSSDVVGDKIDGRIDHLFLLLLLLLALSTLLSFTEALLFLLSGPFLANLTLPVLLLPCRNLFL